MTDPQLQKHKKHCDMWNCELCKTPSSNERELLRYKLLALKSEDGYAISILAAPSALYAIVDFILDRDQATRTQVLEELEAEGPEDKAHGSTHNPDYPLSKGYGEPCYCHLDKVNANNDKWRALLQRKKGNAPQTTVMEKDI